MDSRSRAHEWARWQKESKVSFRLRSPQVLCDAIRVSCSSAACPKTWTPRCTEQEDCETRKVAGTSKGNAIGASVGRNWSGNVQGAKQKIPYDQPHGTIVVSLHWMRWLQGCFPTTSSQVPSFTAGTPQYLHISRRNPSREPIKSFQREKDSMLVLVDSWAGVFLQWWRFLATHLDGQIIRSEEDEEWNCTIVQTSGREILCCPILCAAWSDVATGWWAKGHVVWTNVCDSGRWGRTKELPQLQRSSWGNALPAMPQRMPVVKWSTHPWPIRVSHPAYGMQHRSFCSSYSELYQRGHELSENTTRCLEQVSVRVLGEKLGVAVSTGGRNVWWHIPFSFSTWSFGQFAVWLDALLLRLWCHEPWDRFDDGLIERIAQSLEVLLVAYVLNFFP